MLSPMPLIHGIVSWRAYIAVYDTLRVAGVPEAALSEPVQQAAARARDAHEPVSWDLYLDLVEQGRAWYGTDERFLAACEQFDAAVPEVRAFATPNVRAQEFCRFIFASFDVAAFPDVKMDVRDQPDGSVELELWLPREYRDSTVWMLANVGALKTMTRHLGLPPIEIEAQYDGHHGLYKMRFPKEAEARQEQMTPAMAVVTELVATMRADFERVASAAPSNAERLQQLVRKWTLTARQEQVLACVCEGMSNKQIADRLQCAVRTVEIHVSDILRKANLESRSQLVASFALPEA
jgi:DNA-binding CsgD family transcriptional regulator